MNPSTSSFSDFRSGLVFGCDVGTGSIGYAVRKGSAFRDVGVLICPEETNDLTTRRTLRRQRRRLRSRKYRRQWFAQELERLGLDGGQSQTDRYKLVVPARFQLKDDHAEPPDIRCG